MIEGDEIRAKATEYDVHTSHIQRDYVFGWLLCATFKHDYLGDRFILKGGNCFRKVYFPDTRYSNDLDFSTQAAIDSTRMIMSLKECCQFIQEQSGVVFYTERTRFESDKTIDTEITIWKGRLYFRDFYGAESTITISIRFDVAEFDRVHLPIQRLPLIHPYSDAAHCTAIVRCISLEELIALKMKCLIQRRHSYDLYDLVYSVFFEHEIEIDRLLIVDVSLRITIFSRSPGSAKAILIGLPMAFFRTAWEKYIACPIRSRIDFDRATERFKSFIEELFDVAGGHMEPSLAYFPADMRNMIMEDGAQKRLMHIRYSGVDRHVEPYSLVYKRRKDGVAQEYFYVWDRTGGRSSEPGIRSLLNHRIETMTVLDETFEPRYTIELAKAGERPERGYFGRSVSDRSYLGSGRSAAGRSSPRRRSYLGTQVIYIIQCPICGRRFNRRTYSMNLNRHKDEYGGDCSGRIGYLVDTRS